MYWNDFQSSIRHLSKDDQQLIREAYELGERAHGKQKRKSGEPYFTHPIAVAKILIDLGADRDTIIATLLHDTVEDTPLTLQEIHHAFGATVSDLIDGVTKLTHSDMGAHPTLDEQIETLRKMFTLMQQDVRIMVIKLADRLHNMQTIGFVSPAKQASIAHETIDVYVKIADRLCMRDMRDELESLCLAVLEPELHAQLHQLRQQNETLTESLLPVLRDGIASVTPNISFTSTFEPKTWGKLRMQLEIEGVTPTGVTGINVAFVCEDIPHCYALLGALHQTWKREAMSFEDFINAPVVNGYKGLHTTIFLENGIRLRCKIRTRDMDAYAHQGVTLHCFNSKALGIFDYLPWTRNVANIAEDTKDRSTEFWDSLQSDILQESMVIYGSNGQSALVPRGSTALDGAYFLLRAGANRVLNIRINGHVVPLSQPIEHAATLDIELGEELAVSRERLHSVKTAFASSMIRTALAQHSKEELIMIGRSIMQDALLEQGKWYLEEFGQDLLLRAFHPLGYSSVAEAYAAIAEGRLDSNVAVASITSGLPRHKEHDRPEQVTISFDTRTPTEAHALLEHMTVIPETVGLPSNVQITSSSKGAHIVYGGQLPRRSIQMLKQTILNAGGQHIQIRGSMRTAVALMLLVVFFWALNPVIAKWFLLQNITPMTLLTIRSLSFFILSTLFLATWSTLHGGLFTPIPRGTRIALLPAFSSLLLTLCTYLSLSWLPASVHLTILRLNVFLLPLIAMVHGTVRKRVVLLSLLTGMCALAAFTAHNANAPIGIFFAVATLFAYMLYSHITERTMQKGKIGIRYPYFLFQLGCIFGVVGALLTLTIDTTVLTAPLLGQIFLYTLFCVFVPHTCFHAVLQRTHFPRITNLSLLEVPLAIAFEALLLSITLPISEYLVMGGIMFAATLFALRGLIKTTME